MQPRLVIVTYNSLSLSLSVHGQPMWDARALDTRVSYACASGSRDASSILTSDLLRRKKRPRSWKINDTVRNRARASTNF